MLSTLLKVYKKEPDTVLSAGDILEKRHIFYLRQAQPINGERSNYNTKGWL